MVYIFYALYISVDLAHHEIFRAKDGKGSIKKSYSGVPTIKRKKITQTRIVEK